MGAAKTERWLEEATRAYRAGRLQEARDLYRRILRRSAFHLDANYLLGTLLAEQGELEEAGRLLTRAAQVAPGSPWVHNNLGNVLRLQGRLGDAIACYERALQASPTMAEAHCNAGFLCQRLRRYAEAETHYRSALGASPELLPARKGLAFSLEAQGRREEAAAAYRSVLELKPDDATARHMLAALSGETTACAPAGYVAELFDQYADRYEEHLVGELETAVPAELRRAVAAASPGQRFRAMADLGCGTGLAGAAFRDTVDRLVGMDLSRRMLAQAEAKGVYDALLAGDVVELLAAAQERFDLFVASDVVVYIGDLAPLFEAVAAAAATSALFAFSTEVTDRDDFALSSVGRYAHRPEYVTGMARRHGFATESSFPGELRKEGGAWVSGRYFVLRRMA